ncbi:prepilin-type N-terminal cleavage/methylation domain-containing protein [Oleiagrimonas sp. C23AA]|uniref:prepilin-type N-terminal cleavage/methylation domain-containing protein n=1 Tax=Oleiagrimonas sp. C23AA TaxID=2719047 RepID=UPI001422029C|nr:prepilin-type N-terminal cleavage/methylation domain-containing protein [Oleiagrimonas sp. C23AA]NII12067.1 prepilin-type N-terminal cleavage/methylation domain-containing protein [Oleiagrimonas sp. C23AA]
MKARGFTLLEVLATMALLSLLLLGVWSGLHGATRAVSSGRKAIDHLDSMRGAQDYLRRELTQAQPLPFAQNHDDEGIIFQGDAQRLRFVAPLPGYLGRLGPQQQTLTLVQGKHGYRLQLQLALLPPDGSPPKALGKPQVLLRGIRNGHFSYRGTTERGKVLAWATRWGQDTRLPSLVRIDLDLGKGRDWPLLEVPLRVDAHAVRSAMMSGRASRISL